MARMALNAGAINDKEGNPINPTARSSGNGASFALIEPGFYTAKVNGLKFGEYRGKGATKNAQSSDGKWTYIKVSPDVKLLNANGTVINRQDIPVGATLNGSLVRPDGDTSKSAMWPLAQYLLGSLGLLLQDEETGDFYFDFDPDLISDRIVKVRTAVGGYIKGERGYEPDEITAMLTETNDGIEYTFDEIPDLVFRWNEDNGYDNEDEVRLKVKNVIIGFYALDERTIREQGFYLDESSQAVFISEADHAHYLRRLDQAVAGTPDDVSDIPF